MAETELEARLAHLEARVAALEWQLSSSGGPPAAPPGVGLPGDVVEALHAGKEIEAIKRLRAQTGMGLAEAKAAVEAATS